MFGGGGANERTRGLSVAGMSNRRRASYAFPVNPAMLKRLSLADGPEISSNVEKPTLFDNTAYRQFQTYNHLSTTLLMEYDNVVRRKNILLNILAFLGIFLGIILLESSWDEKRQTWTEEQEPSEVAIKVLSSLTTIALMWQLVEYYRYQHRAERRTWYIPDSLEWQKFKWFFLLIELGISVIHPFPTFPSTARVYDNTLATFLIFRIYLVVRLVRDYCPVYRQRAGIIASTLDRSTGNPQFNWVLTSRYFFRHYMWRTVLLGMGLSLVVFGYGDFVLERSETPNWTYGLALWNTAVTMTTVGYGDYAPTWAGSRACQLLAAFSGILLTSLTIFVIIQSLEYSYVERRAYNRYKLHGISIRQRKLAARYIQFQWKRYTYLKKVAPTDTQKNRNHAFARYVIKNVALMSKLQHYRRQQTLILSEQRKHETKVVGGGNSDNVVDPTSGTITRRDSIAPTGDEGDIATGINTRKNSRSGSVSAPRNRYLGAKFGALGTGRSPDPTPTPGNDVSADTASSSSLDSDEKVTMDELNEKIQMLDTSVTQVRTTLQTLQRTQDDIVRQLNTLSTLPEMIQQVIHNAQSSSSSSSGSGSGSGSGLSSSVALGTDPLQANTTSSSKDGTSLAATAGATSSGGSGGSSIDKNNNGSTLKSPTFAPTPTVVHTDPPPTLRLGDGAAPVPLKPSLRAKRPRQVSISFAPSVANNAEAADEGE